MLMLLTDLAFAVLTHFAFNNECFQVLVFETCAPARKTYSFEILLSRV
jgi:hypothetical protein